MVMAAVTVAATTAAIDQTALGRAAAQPAGAACPAFSATASATGGTALQ
jgi:hypothetical protein